MKYKIITEYDGDICEHGFNIGDIVWKVKSSDINKFDSFCDETAYTDGEDYWWIDEDIDISPL